MKLFLLPLRREALDEKPALAGGRVTLRAWSFLAAEAEIDRFTSDGGYSAYSGTEFLFGNVRRHQFQGTAGFGLCF